MKLKEIRKQRKMSQAKLAEKLGVSRSTVSMWEIGASQPDNDNLLQLAQILNISLDVLLGNDASSAEDASYVLPVQIKRVPLLGNIACGEPIFAEEEHGEYIYTSDALDVDFCLRAQGDSMIGARIYDGDIVFVRRQDMVDDGEIAAVLIGDEATLKRVRYDKEAETLSLYPENPKYKTMHFSGEELEEIKILGQSHSLSERNPISIAETT